MISVLNDQNLIRGKIVLLRADYNVPIVNGKVMADGRLRSSLAVIRQLLSQGAERIVLLSHLGRPNGRDLQFSLRPVAERLAELLGEPIELVAELEDLVVAKNHLVLLENLRFWPGEADNDLAFAQQLVKSSGAELFIQDGFGVAHRRTATTDAITKLLPSLASSNFAHEYQTIVDFIENAPRPLTAIVGGAKISDKIDFLLKLAELADYLVVGGAMANVFLQRAGHEIGLSQTESEQIATVERIYQIWQTQGKDVKNIILPVDVRVAEDLMAQSSQSKLLSQVTSHDIIGDIGPRTSQRIQSVLARTGSILWNGTLGYAENLAFRQGSLSVAEAIKRYRPLGIIGGGDTVGFVDNFTTLSQNDNLFLSTGGGAALELIAYGELPGAKALLNA